MLSVNRGLLLFADCPSKMDEVVDDPLPEDDSIFANLSNRTDNVSSDALIEDPSFSAFALAADGLTSTPSVGKSRRNKSAPTPSENRSPSQAAGELSGDSPRRSPRLASRDSYGDSPRPSPRLTLSSNSFPKGPPRIASRGVGIGRGHQLWHLQVPVLVAVRGSHLLHLLV